MNKIYGLIFLLVIPFTGIGQNQDCAGVLATAASFLSNGNTAPVKKILNQTRSTCTGDAAWYYIQYGYHTALNRPDSAQHYLLQAQQKFAKNDSVHYLLAQAYLLEYDSTMAARGLKAIDKALEIKNKPGYLLCKAQLLRMASQPVAALAVIAKIPDLNNDYDAQVEWGILLNESGRPKEALQKFNRAVKIDPYYPTAYLQKASLYFEKLNNQDAALAALDTVEMIDTSLADPMLVRAAFFERHNDFENAIGEYDLALDTDSSVHQVYVLRGNCFKEIKDFDNAEADYKQYKKLNPHEKEVDYMVADLYIAKGDYNAAALLMTQLETTGESQYDLYLLRGIAYMNNGQYERALEDLNKAEQFSERDAQLYHNRGLCYYNQKEFRKAKYDFEKAINHAPDNMELHYLHCQAAYHAGFKDEACRSCKLAQFHHYQPIDKLYLKDCHD